jgi:hypothetical protein
VRGCETLSKRDHSVCFPDGAAFVAGRLSLQATRSTRYQSPEYRPDSLAPCGPRRISPPDIRRSGYAWLRAQRLPGEIAIQFRRQDDRSGFNGPERCSEIALENCVIANVACRPGPQVYPNANAQKLSHYPGLSLCLEGLKAAIRWALFDFHSS